MEEGRRRRAPEESRETELASGGGEEILAADHEIDALFPVIDGDGELVGPLTEPVADEEIAALRHRVLGLWPKPQIIEALRCISRHDDAQPLTPDPWSLTSAGPG
ncbi:MAG: hypothetical protein RI891_1638, partial [Gemmatimonadota bacterium]